MIGSLHSCLDCCWIRSVSRGLSERKCSNSAGVLGLYRGLLLTELKKWLSLLGVLQPASSRNKFNEESVLRARAATFCLRNVI